MKYARAGMQDVGYYLFRSERRVFFYSRLDFMAVCGVIIHFAGTPLNTYTHTHTSEGRLTTTIILYKCLFWRDRVRFILANDKRFVFRIQYP